MIRRVLSARSCGSARAANGNLGLGQNVLLVNTGGTSNTGVGQSALASLTTASNNTALGYRALADNTSGNGNTAIGTQALALSTISTQNTAVGFQALQNTSSGQQNTAIGNVSLGQNTYGSNNTALGYNTLNVSITTSNNTAIGSSALSTSTGQNNTAVGVTALKAITSGSQDTAIGYRAGERDNQQTDFQTLSTITGATLLGASTQATCSSCVILGGQGADAVNYGLGTPNPTNFLSVEPLEFNGGGGTVATHSNTTVDTLSSGSFLSSMIGSEIYIASNSSTTATFKATNYSRW